MLIALINVICPREGIFVSILLAIYILIASVPTAVFQIEFFLVHVLPGWSPVHHRLPQILQTGTLYIYN